MQGYTGISFPFRVGVRGGVIMSTTNVQEVPHIIESITQILGTKRLERPMEYHIYSDVDTAIFEPQDSSTYTFLKYQVEEALRLETRIEVVSVIITNKENAIFAEINFKVIQYDTMYNTTVKVGDI